MSLKGGDERNSIGAAVDGKFMGDGVVGGCATGVIDAVGVGGNGAISGCLVKVEVGVAGEVGEMSRVDEAGTEGESGKVGEVVPVDVASEVSRGDDEVEVGDESVSGGVAKEERRRLFRNSDEEWESGEPRSPSADPIRCRRRHCSCGSGSRCA